MTRRNSLPHRSCGWEQNTNETARSSSGWAESRSAKALGSCGLAKSRSAAKNTAAGHNRDCRATGRWNSAAEARRSVRHWNCRAKRRLVHHCQPTAGGQPKREASSAKACWPGGSRRRSLARDGRSSREANFAPERSPGDPSRIPAVRVRGRKHGPELPKRGNCRPGAAKTFPKEYFRTGLRLARPKAAGSATAHAAERSCRN